MKYLLALFASSLFLTTLVTTSQASASFNPGRIMDDAVMSDHGSMSVADIQRFLDSKVTCDTWGEEPSEYGGGTRAQYAASRGWQSPPYYCMTTYVEGGKSAAQLVYDKAQKYRISPKVLIVLLQKEQGLITDEWPLYNPQYKTATGYGCPDTAPCDSQYFGLANQLDWAAKMFRSILDNSPYWYTPYILGDNYIQYNPNTSCGGSTVKIQNRATQALYNYTPYQPNQAALDAGWGQATCGAYGNRNFYLYYTSWFGNTLGGPTYKWSMDSFDIYRDSTLTEKIPKNYDTYSLKPGQTVYAQLKARNLGAHAWSDKTLLQTTNTPVLGNNSWISHNKVSTLSTYPVGYNEVGTYNFTLTAPVTAGGYHQELNLNHSDVNWFNRPGVHINVDAVKPLTLSPLGDSNQLSPNEKLTDGQSIYSPGKSSVLRFENGQTNLYVNFKKVWSTSVPNSKAEFIRMQSDGNLVMYTKDWKPVWASGTSTTDSTLSLQSDGNLVIRNASGHAVWSSNTPSPNEAENVNTRVNSNDVIHPGQSMNSADRKYRLVLQTDGNIVYYNDNWKPLWASNTAGKPAEKLVMQSDGNLVLYTKDWKPLWASNTVGNKNSWMKLQNDRNIVIYNEGWQAKWATHTSGK